MSSNRLLSIDALRGLVILFMLLDHVRETFYLHQQVGDPMDVTATEPALFFSRTTSESSSALAATTCLTAPALADDERIVVGFATTETGFMQAYDKPAQDAATAGAWFDFDPTNNRCGWGSPGEDYVTLATGRDFGDVSPMRGVIQSGADHTLQVAVTVAPPDELKALEAQASDPKD